MNDLAVIGDRRGPLAKPSDTARTLAAASLSANTRRAYAGALKRLDTYIGEGVLDDTARAGDSVSLVRKWLARSGVRHGRVFRSLCRGAVGKRLDASQVPRIFKAMAHHGGLPVEVVERISGHSTRVPHQALPGAIILRTNLAMTPVAVRKWHREARLSITSTMETSETNGCGGTRT